MAILASNRAWDSFGIGFLVLLMAASPADAAAPTSDPVAERGLAATTRDRPLVQSAIEKANLLLVEGRIRLRAAWIVPADGPDRDAVPVFLVAAKDTSLSSPAFVPKGCACIFVNPALLSQWATTHSKGDGRWKLDRPELLTYMLLHEVGHLAKGTSGGAVEHGELTQFNVDPAVAKVNEEDADGFAADLLRGYFRRTPVTDASTEANKVVTQLLYLSWNMQRYRAIDEFAASMVGKPSVYFDNGYSHPNLAWRVLRSNYLIHRNEQTKMLLDEFEAARKRGMQAAPIYERRKAGPPAKQ